MRCGAFHLENGGFQMVLGLMGPVEFEAVAAYRAKTILDGRLPGPSGRAITLRTCSPWHGRDAAEPRRWVMRWRPMIGADRFQIVFHFYMRAF